MRISFRRFVVGASGCSGVAIAYRFAFVKIFGPHKPAPVEIKFTLEDLDVSRCFDIIRNPRLLDETTPPWFRLIIRDSSKDVVDEFLRKTSSRVLVSLEEGSAENTVALAFPVYLNYLMLAFFVPFPWTSKVLYCGICNDASGQSSDLCYRLTYEQYIGPFLGGFYHDHFVKSAVPGTHGSIVEDVIEFDVTSEPIVNSITWYVLDWLLRGRAKSLVERYGSVVS